MRRNIFIEIKNEYDRRRQRAFEDLQKRKAEIYSLYPQIYDLDKQIKETALKYNIKILKSDGSSGDKPAKELDNLIERFKSEKKEFLVSKGYPPDYLEMSYKCYACKDTGFIEGYNGTVQCNCYKQQLIDRLYSQSNLLASKYENFDYFNENYYNQSVNKDKYGTEISPRENIISIRKRCTDFINNFSDSSQKNLYFTGRTGVGKTFMARCIAHELITGGHTVLYQTAPVLFDIIAQHKIHSYREDEEDQAFDDLFDVELLIIDDLGTEHQTTSRYAELLNILNTRTENNLARPCKTIIATNLSIRKLYENYTERVASRIIGSFDIFEFTGDDIRVLKRFENN